VPQNFENFKRGHSLPGQVMATVPSGAIRTVFCVCDICLSLSKHCVANVTASFPNSATDAEAKSQCSKPEEICIRAEATRAVRRNAISLRVRRGNAWQFYSTLTVKWVTMILPAALNSPKIW
jgi:hypothetical protein